MNVCLFTTSFLPIVGGMQFVVHHLAETLVDLGCTTTVITNNSKISGKFDHKYRLLRYGYKFRGVEKTGINILSSLLTLKKEHYYNPFDVIHCHSVSFAGTRSALAKKIFGIPLVMTPHGDDIQRIPEINYGLRLNPMWDFIIRKNLSCADAVTAISDSVRNELDFISKDKLFTVPNGTYLNEFFSNRIHFLHDELSVNQNKKIILSVGRNHIKKGYEYGIRAFHLLNKTKSEHDLIYVVVGKDTDQYLPLIERLDLQKKVFLVPQKNRDMILKYYQSAWCFFSPSIVEGLSIVSIEAMASGLPLAVTDVPGNLDIVRDNKCGIIVENKNPRSMADGILKLYSDQGLYDRFSQKCLEQAKYYDWPNIARKYIKIYKQVIDNRKQY